ncbi:MAG: PQQ-binding-like beta-propeller repeat protein [Candidatus Asgardarchaeia archaeon]
MSKYDRRKLVILSMFFLIILLTSSTAISISYQNIQKRTDYITKTPEAKTRELVSKWPYHFDSPLVIFYDEYNSVASAVARDVYSTVSILYSPVELKGVTSSAELKRELTSNYAWIAIYIFNTTLDGVVIGSDIMTWSSLVSFMRNLKGTNHILSFGNTHVLRDSVAGLSNIYISDTEQVDVLLVYMHAVWTISEVLSKAGSSYKNASLDFRRVGLKIFADNFNEIFARTVDPKVPFGVEDLEARQEIFEEKVLSRFPVGAKRLAPAPPGELDLSKYLNANDTTVVTSLSSLGSDYVMPRALLLSEDEVGALDVFPISEVPIKSGLDGPVGKVVDLLLSVLLNPDIGIGNFIGLPTDEITQLLDVFKIIKEILGFIQNPGEKSALQKLIESIADQFPVLEEYKKYFNLVVDAIYVLRGDFSEIVDFIWDVIDALFPDLGSTVETMKTILNQTLSMGTELYNMLQDSSNILDTLLDWFTSQVTQELLSKFLESTLGISGTELTQTLNRIIGIAKTAINFITNFDLDKFLTDIKDFLIKQAFQLLQDSVGEDALNKINAVINLGLVVAGYSDKSLKDAVVEVITQFVDVSDFIDGLESAKQLAEDIISEIDRAIKEELSDLNSFKNFVKQKIEEYLTSTNVIPEDLKNLITEAIALVAGVMNKKFSVSDLPTLSSLIVGILNYVLPNSYSGLHAEDKTDIINTVNKTLTIVFEVIAVVKDDANLKQYLVKNVEKLASDYGLTKKTLFEAIDFVLQKTLSSSTYESIKSKINIGSEVASIVFQMLNFIKDNSFQGIFTTLLNGLGYALVDYYDLDLGNYTKIMNAIIPKVLGIKNVPSAKEAINLVLDALGAVDPTIKDTISQVLDLVLNIKDVFVDGVKWLVNQIMDWLFSEIEELISSVSGDVASIFGSHGYDLINGDYALGLGSLSAFSMHFVLGIDLGFNFNKEKLFDFIYDLIFKGLKWSFDNVADAFKELLSFFEITPMLYSELGVNAFGSEASSFMDFLLESLGLHLSFSGGANFKIQLFSFKGGAFDLSEFFKVIEWGFYFTIELAKDFTLLDFLTAGVGGGALSTLAEYIGLDGITITIMFGLMIEIIKRAASATGPEQSTFTLEITIGAALSLGLDIIIASLSFYGSIEVVFTFIHDLLGTKPMQIFMDIIAHIKVTLAFLFWDLDLEWGPKTIFHHDFTANNKDEAKDQAMGFDSDDDGLPDEYEQRTPGLKIDSPDTDGDGLTDKEETQTTHTDPLNPDTDGDGLSDYDEYYVYKTNPKLSDTDFDGVTDYEELKVYGTNPLTMDTDEDGLDDNFEITHVWDISNITPSVTEVKIGPYVYNDHTDPLDPDTDDDGLLDGEEGEFGPYYGLDILYNESDPNVDAKPLIFNYGHTHPLDNDTDDDSYLQLWNGSIALVASKKVFLRSMTDGEEVKGIWVTFIINGTPERRLVKTNPCNPDTDGDTGADRTPPVPLDAYLSSDGYELALNPPSDPLDGDSDDDGLIDGLEGTLRADSNHTHYLMWDTDGDGLGDLEDTLLGTDPRNPDSDNDMVSDGDEFFIYGTDPTEPDTDHDGLTDGEELYYWHTNPMIKDSDADGISDSKEVLLFDTNPMDEDTDDDGVLDYLEVYVYFTDPFDADTDDDGLSDGYELYTSKTNPLIWDTDGDSIWYPNEYGEMTWPMSDGDEILKYGTNPLVSDTDADGLSDAMELYLASGIIPTIDPIPLDALNNDTDGDSLLDGQELRIKNVSDLVYPYISLWPVFVFNSSPVNNDTDGDTLDDFSEIRIYGTNPNCTDTDNDTIPDGVEVHVYGTDPSKNDTDGDGLADNEEISNTTTLMSNGISGKDIQLFGYGTDPLDNDTDNDLLPDGFEVKFLGSDPLNPDEDSDGILDGYEVDTDGDGLSDGEEFFVYYTGRFPNGGFQNPDSDNDGLSDGAEVHIYGTDPANPDTDGDGYTDGGEVAIGTDPTSPTTKEEYENALNRATAGFAIQIVSPQNITITDFTTDVRVVNATPLQAVWFRYNDGSGWSKNYSMTYSASDRQWVYQDIIWNSTSYHLEVYGNTTTGYVVFDEIWFTVGGGPDYTWLYYTLAAVGVVVAVFLLWFLVLRKKGFTLEKIKGGVSSLKKTTIKGKKKSSKSTRSNTKFIGLLDALSNFKLKITRKLLINKPKRVWQKAISILLVVFFVSNIAIAVNYSILPLPSNSTVNPDTLGSSNNILNQIDNNFNWNTLDSSNKGGWYPNNYDMIKWLSNTPNEYQKVWEPWITKAAVHAIAISDDEDIMAIAGGYLFDNEIHIYRWNNIKEDYERVWESGDGIIQGDILALAIGDTDNNHFMEIIAASADGHIYVFEQRHIYDPITNTENEFELVWTSPKMRPVWSLTLGDADKDGKLDIIAGAWDNRIHVFEFIDHSGYPFSEEHWINYKEVWTSPELDDKVYSVAVGDLNYNGLPEIIAGTRNGSIYIFENDGIVLYIEGHPFPLTNDNNYVLNSTISGYIWRPIYSMSVGELDGDNGDEIALVAPGQGAYVLDYQNNEFMLHKLIKPFESWELGTGALGAGHPLDVWVDYMVYGYNVYFVEGSNVYNEPSEDPSRSISPYNSAMVSEIDGKFSQFNSTVDNESIAVVDFGRHEEPTGNGNSKPDLNLTFVGLDGFSSTPNFNNLEFYASMDNYAFEKIDTSDLSVAYHGNNFSVSINLDNVLAKRHWDHSRYLKIVVKNGDKYAIDAIEVLTVFRPIRTATAITIAKLNIDTYMEYKRWAAHYFSEKTSYDLEYWYSAFGVKNESNKVIIGTVLGKLLAFKYNKNTGEYSYVWDTYSDDYYKVGTNIWFMKEIKRAGKIPTFIALGYNLNGINITNSLPSDEHFNYMASIDFDNDGDLDYLVGTKEARVEFLDDFTTYNSTFTSNVFGSINTYYSSGMWLSPTFANLFGSSVPYLVIGAIDPTTITTDPMSGGTTSASLDIWIYDSGSGTYPYPSSLTNYDRSHTLETILALSTTTPEAAFADMDGDGDLDMTVTNGKLYYFENIGNSTRPRFMNVIGYYKAINEKYSEPIRGPQLVDFDKDGDYDIIFSFDGVAGATYFVNEGTPTSPIWVEKNRLFSNPTLNGNFAYNNLTLPIIVRAPNGSWYNSLKDAVGMGYFIYAYNMYTKSVVTGFVDTVYPTHFIIGTNPLIKRMDFALSTSSSTLPIFGYHIFETWSNSKELEKWTITVEHSDVDGDGRNEVIIGDFDNNLYVFEHMVNNTYKRAFRSFDLYHNLTTNLSPYAWENLEGISANFTRRIWDHVTELATNVDLDHDGFQEIVVAANLTIYVFEFNGIDDHYDLVWSINLWDTEILWYAVTSDIFIPGEITALAVSNDLDYNGKGEIIVGLGSLLLIFESSGDNNFTEVFQNKLIPNYGRYDLPGNPFVSVYAGRGNYDQLIINAITVDDTDNDGLKEIIMVGANATFECAGYDGFVAVIENKIGTYGLVWYAPINTTYQNEMYAVTTADQDYDGLKEIVVGHRHGVDIWEYINGTDAEYRYVEFITSSVNYPKLEVRDLYDFVYSKTFEEPNMDILYTKNDGIFLVYSAKFSNSTGTYVNLYMRRSFDGGKTWTAEVRVFPDNFYLQFGRHNATREYEPSLYQTKDGTIWIAWLAETHADTSPTTSYDMYVARWTGSSWGLASKVGYSSIDVVRYLSIWEYSGPEYIVGVSYVMYFFGAGIYWQGFDGSSWSSWHLIIDDQHLLYNNFTIVRSADMYSLDDGSYILAFTAKYRSERKTDNDIWVMTANSSMYWSSPQRVTDEFTEDGRPSITQLKSDDKTVMIIYQRYHSSALTDAAVVYSKNNGRTWSKPEGINVIANALKRDCNPYSIGYSIYGNHITKLIVAKPVISGSPNEGFVYSGFYTLIYRYTKPETVTLHDIIVGVNPTSNWTHYDNIYKTQAVAVGDTDKDGRFEIALGSLNNVAVLEIVHSGSRYMEHAQVWTLPNLQDDVMDISVGDGNGNGWPEIVFTTGKGNVYAYELATTNITMSEITLAPKLVSEGDFSSSYMYILPEFAKLSGPNPMLILALRNGTFFIVDKSGSVQKTVTVPGALTQKFAVYDVNNDGIDDLIAGFDDGSVIAISGSDFSRLWRITVGGDTVIALKVFDKYNDKSEVFVFAATYDGNITKIDGKTGTTLWTDSLGERIVNIQVAPFPSVETVTTFVILYNNTLALLNYTNGDIVNAITFTNQFYDVAIADVDGDNNTEIFLSAGSFVALDSNLEVIWNNTKLLGYSDYRIKLADTNNDGIIEGFAFIYLPSSSEYHVIAFNTKNGRILSDILTSAGFYEIELYDIDNSGTLDVILPYFMPNAPLVVLDGSTFKPMMLYGDNGFVPFFTAVSDMDNDGIPEIAIGGIYGEFKIINPMPFGKTYSAKATNLDASFEYISDSRVSSISSGDLTGDGIDDIILTTYDKHLYIFNPVKIIASIPTNDLVHVSVVNDIDNDGVNEIVVCGNGGYVVIYNYTNGNILTEETYASSHTVFTDIAISNISGDSKKEIIVTFYKTAYPYPKGFMFFDSALNLIAENSDPTSTVNSLIVADTNNDGNGDYIVGAAASYIYVLDTSGTTVWSYSLSSEYISGYDFYINENGDHILAVGSYSTSSVAGYVREFIIETGSLDSSITYAGDYVYGITGGRFRSKSYEDLAVLLYADRIEFISGTTGVILKSIKSNALFETTYIRGSNSMIYSVDINNDGYDEVLMFNLGRVFIVSYSDEFYSFGDGLTIDGLTIGNFDNSGHFDVAVAGTNTGFKYYMAIYSSSSVSQQSTNVNELADSTQTTNLKETVTNEQGTINMYYQFFNILWLTTVSFAAVITKQKKNSAKRKNF